MSLTRRDWKEYKARFYAIFRLVYQIYSHFGNVLLMIVSFVLSVYTISDFDVCITLFQTQTGRSCVCKNIQQLVYII